MEHFDLDYYGRLRDPPNDVIAREFEWRYPERAPTPPSKSATATPRRAAAGRSMSSVPQQRGEPPSRRADRRPRRFPVQCHYRHVGTLVRRVPGGH